MATLLPGDTELSLSQASPKLTARQESVLAFLRDFTTTHHYPPTIRQIGKHFGIGSPNGVMFHLDALERKGLIVRDPMTARGIRVVRD